VRPAIRKLRVVVRYPFLFLLEYPMNTSVREPTESPVTPLIPTSTDYEAGRQRLAELIGHLLAKRWLSTQSVPSPGDHTEVPPEANEDH
jgi:hypothetical protein